MADARVFTPDEIHIDLPDAYTVKSKNREGTQGEGAVVGIVDSGVNILHSAFLTTDPVPRTRIAAMWIQHGELTAGTTALWDRWGTVIEEGQINEILDKVAQGKTVAVAIREIGIETDVAKSKALADLVLDLQGGRSSHGTAVASIAAGTPWRRRGRANLVGGVAPQSKLVVVSHRKSLSGLGFTLHEELAAGVHFCFTKAAPAPCVVNLSIGFDRAPRTGQAKFNTLVAPLLTNQPGRALVAAAGNTGERHKHLRFASPRTVKIHVPDGTTPRFSMYVSSQVDVLVQVEPPVTPVSGNLRHSIIKSGDTLDDATGHKHTEILVLASSPFKFVAGPEWKLKIDDPSPVVDLWIMGSRESHVDDIRIEPIDPAAGSREDNGLLAPWNRSPDSIRHSLVPFATGKDVITVSSMFLFKGTVDYHFMTSRGPTTDPGRTSADAKPDLAAPGFAIRAAHWRPSASLGPKGLSTAADGEGTSYAAPFVTGAVALMLSHNPALTSAKIREILRTKTRLPFGINATEASDLQTTYQINIQDMLGQGVLSVKRALEQVSADLGP